MPPALTHLGASCLERPASLAQCPRLDPAAPAPPPLSPPRFRSACLRAAGGEGEDELHAGQCWLGGERPVGARCNPAKSVKDESGLKRRYLCMKPGTRGCEPRGQPQCKVRGVHSGLKNLPPSSAAMSNGVQEATTATSTGCTIKPTHPSITCQALQLGFVGRQHSEASQQGGAERGACSACIQHHRHPRLLRQLEQERGGGGEGEERGASLWKQVCRWLQAVLLKGG